MIHRLREYIAAADIMSWKQYRWNTIFKSLTIVVHPTEPVSYAHADWPHAGSEGERVQTEDLPPCRDQSCKFLYLCSFIK